MVGCAMFGPRLGLATGGDGHLRTNAGAKQSATWDKYGTRRCKDKDYEVYKLFEDVRLIARRSETGH
jgi:hypothetical protein